MITSRCFSSLDCYHLLRYAGTEKKPNRVERFQFQLRLRLKDLHQGFSHEDLMSISTRWLSLNFMLSRQRECYSHWGWEEKMIRLNRWLWKLRRQQQKEKQKVSTNSDSGILWNFASLWVPSSYYYHHDSFYSPFDGRWIELTLVILYVQSILCVILCPRPANEKLFVGY